MKEEQLRRHEMGFHILKNGKKAFEGWYYRLTDERCSLAVIVGFSPEQAEKPFFIQTLDTLTERSQKVDFSWDQVHIEQEPFCLKLKENEFSLTTLKLDLDLVQARLQLTELTPLPFSRYAPTIMGPFSYFPKMECVHGVISLHHTMEGIVKLAGRTIPVKGIGYLEKDRGTSFPRQYCWFQSNQCGIPQSCLFFSLADIPVGPFSFNGVLLVIKIGKQIYRFATYTGCRLKSIVQNKQGKETGLHLGLRQGLIDIILELKMGENCSLASPKNGKMTGTVRESLTAEAHVTLLKRGCRIHESLWKQGGMEVYPDKEK